MPHEEKNDLGPSRTQAYVADGPAGSAEPDWMLNLGIVCFMVCLMAAICYRAVTVFQLADTGSIQPAPKHELPSPAVSVKPASSPVSSHSDELPATLQPSFVATPDDHDDTGFDGRGKRPVTVGTDPFAASLASTPESPNNPVTPPGKAKAMTAPVGFMISPISFPPRGRWDDLLVLVWGILGFEKLQGCWILVSAILLFYYARSDK